MATLAVTSDKWLILSTYTGPVMHDGQTIQNGTVYITTCKKNEVAHPQNQVISSTTKIYKLQGFDIAGDIEVLLKQSMNLK